MKEEDAPDVDLVVLRAREEEVAVGVVDNLGERSLVTYRQDAAERVRGASVGLALDWVRIG